MNKCPNCGIVADVNFCPECGTKMIPFQEEKVCPKCGYAGDYSFCPECGTEMCSPSEVTAVTTTGSVNSDEPQDSRQIPIIPVSTPQKKKSKLPFIIGAVAIVIILALVFGIKSSSSDTQTATNTTASTTTNTTYDTYDDSYSSSDWGETTIGTWTCTGAFMEPQGIISMSELSAQGYDVSIELTLENDNTYSMTSDFGDGSRYISGAYYMDDNGIVLSDFAGEEILGMAAFTDDKTQLLLTFGEEASEDGLYFVLSQY